MKKQRTRKEIKFSESKKQVVLNLLAYVASFLGTTVISFVLTPFLVDKLGKDTYSFYPIANTIVNYMIIVSSALNSMASRFVSISLFKGETEDANKYFSSTILVDSIISIILFLVGAAIIVFLDKFLDVPLNHLASIRLLFILIFSSAIVNIMSSVFGIATFAKNKISWRSARELAISLVRLGIIVVMYLAFPPNIFYIGLAAFVVAIINLLIQFVFTKKLLPEIEISRKDVSKSHIKTLFFGALWVSINSLGNQLLTGMTIIMANSLYGASFSGNISLAQTIPSFLGGIVSAMVFAFYPIITKKYADNDKDGLIGEIVKVQKIVGGFVCAIIAVFAAVSLNFFQLWVPKENPYELNILSLLLTGIYYSTSCFWVMTSVATSLNKVKIPAISLIGCGVINLLLMLVARALQLSYLALPIISIAIQFIWQTAFLPIYISKQIGTSPKKFYLVFLKCILTSLIVFGVSYALSRVILVTSWLRFVIFAFVAGSLALSIFAAVLLGNDIARFPLLLKLIFIKKKK